MTAMQKKVDALEMIAIVKLVAIFIIHEDFFFVCMWPRKK